MFNIVFDEKFDCLICLNSKLPSLGFFIKYFPDIPTIGADGGAVRLFEKGIICDYVVGDLDTFFKSNIEKYFTKSKIIYEPDQEINDFEKSLLYAQQNGYQKILVLGFHGGELEHTLNNWSIIKKYCQNLTLCIFEKGRYGIPLYQSFSVSTKTGELISIIPQPKAKLRTNNLKWNLDNEILELGYREGARNIATDNSISIELIEGQILLFIDARLPFCYRKEKWTR